MKMSETIRETEERPRLPRKEMMAMRASVALKADEGERVGLEIAAKEIGRRIGGVRGRVGRVAMWRGLGMALGMICGWLVSETAVDFLVELPWVGRLGFLVIGVGGALGLWGYFGVREWWRRRSDEEVALLVERALPELRSRLIAAVQLAKMAKPSSPGLVGALVAETTQMVGRLSFKGVVATRSMWRWIWVGLVGMLIVVGLGFLGGHRTKPLVRRAFLYGDAVPRQTMIEDVTGDRVIAIGDDLGIGATARGIVPWKGRLRVKTVAGKASEFELGGVEGKAGRFHRVLQSVQEPFEYRVLLGDAVSEVFRVKVKPRPAVASVECEQIWPKYTGIGAQRRALGDLKLLVGSRLVLKVKASTAVKFGEIRLVGVERDKVVVRSPLVIKGEDATQLSGEVLIPKEGVTGMTLRLVDEDGVESRGAAVYHINLVTDTAPTVKIIWPDRREILMTREGTALISFEAKDDYGVGKVRLNYAVDWVEGGAFKTTELEMGAVLPKVITKRFDWKVGAIVPRVVEGSVIDYWFEVTDLNDITGPGRGVSEHYQARIVSDAEKRADLANRLSDTMEGLNGLKRGQEEVNAKLGEIIFEKPSGEK